MNADEKLPNSETPQDPHASKISPNDERLFLKKPKTRALNGKKLQVAGGVGLMLLVGALFYETSPEEKPEPVLSPESETSSSAHDARVPDAVYHPVEKKEDKPQPPRRKPSAGVGRPTAPPPGDFDSYRRETSNKAPAFYQASQGATATKQEEEQAKERKEAERKWKAAQEAARTADVFVEVAGAKSQTNVAPSAATSRYASAAAGSNLPLDRSGDPNGQVRKNAFLSQQGPTSDYLGARLQRPRSPYELKAASTIKGALLTTINSDLPGPIIGAVTESVVDSVTGNTLLIPQGSKLLGSYDSVVAFGQERILMCWNRILLPNGDSVNIGCMPGADLKGTAGMTGEVDEHWGRLIAAGGLSTILSLGLRAATASPGPTTQQPSLAQETTANAAQQFSSIGQSVVQRGLNIQPTIMVEAGTTFNVVVTKDMILRPYEGETK